MGESRFRAAVRAAGRLPFTLALMLAILVIGAVGGGLFAPAPGFDWLEGVAYGLPAFEAGRWWTPVTGMLFVERPWQYLTILVLIAGGVGWAERRFGSLRAAGIFLAGHLVGVLGAALFLFAVAPTGWAWAERLAGTLDVGASCGALACLVFAIATLPSPWRLRARIAVGAWTGIAVLYLGTLADLEHLFAVAAALLVSGLLPAFRRPAGRPTEREWRLIALAGLIVIGVVQLIDARVPYDGPLGANETSAGDWGDVLIDVVVIALVANGIRRGYRLAWWIAVALGVFNVLTLFAVVALIEVLMAAGAADGLDEVLGQVLAPAVLWLAELGILIAARGAFRVRLRPSRRVPGGTADRDDMLTAVRRYGGGTISWMTGWAGNEYARVGDGLVAYQRHSGVAIALGDPVCAPGERAAVVDGFVRAAQQSGLVPCFFSVGRETVDAAPPGWRATEIAEDTIIDLPGLELSGKKWQPVRSSVNRADREDIAFRLTRLGEEPWAVLAQVRAISEQWSGDKGLPEMRFTLGTVQEALDPEVRVGIAVDEEGSLHGVTSWLPVYGGDGRVHGWTLDLMRRRDGGFPPVMEFLIASSALAFAEEGYDFVSLSGAPLARSGDAEELGPVDRVLAALGAALEPLYGFRSLHRFKTKFNPRYEPLFLLYRDEGDLPRIGLALTRAYLPDASLRELAVLGFSGER